VIFAHVHVSDVIEPHEPAELRELFIKEASSAHFFSVLRRLSLIRNLDIRNQTMAITSPTLIV
jgi:hypothetical protein